MSAKAKAHLYRQLAQLIGSGFHLDRSLDLLLGQQPDRAVKPMLLGLRAGVASGIGLGESAKSHTSPLEHAMLSAGERSGRLAEACAHLADHFDTAHRSREAAINALIYPVVLAHIGVALPVLTALPPVAVIWLP